MRRILITGASGMVATALTKELIQNVDTELYLVSTNPEKLSMRYADSQNVHVLTLDDCIQTLQNVSLDVIIHTAFARTGKAVDYVSSLEFTEQLLSFALLNQPKAYINISSQSVYGNTEPWWKESSPICPDTLYAMAKYATEEMTVLALEKELIKYTNVRLCSICEPQRFVYKMVSNVLKQKPIYLTAPNDECSFIDMRDVTNGICALLQHIDDVPWERVYNLGANIRMTIAEVAHIIQEIAERQYHFDDVQIVEECGGKPIRYAGMDASLFMNTFDWRPKYSMKDMIEQILRSQSNE